MLRSSHLSGDVMNDARLQIRIEPLRAALARHPVYGRVGDLPSLRIFMQSHVFAVWDFMTLVKTLQAAVTCVTTPWLPPRDARAARLINAIVLGEESDEVASQEYASHFDLYLTAMHEVGADHGPIDAFIGALRSGVPAEEAINTAPIPETTRNFVRTTLRIAREGTVHEVAAAFLHGREDLVPLMFRRIIATLEGERLVSCEAFRRYLDRHVEVDEHDHGPMAHQLLRSLCDGDAARWDEAADAAREALSARLRLWDGVIEQLGTTGEVARARRAACGVPKEVHI